MVINGSIVDTGESKEKADKILSCFFENAPDILAQYVKGVRTIIFE